MSGQYPSWDSTNVFIRIRFYLKLINLDYLANTASFLPTFWYSEITWSSKLRFLPITVPSNFCFALSQIFSSTILTQTFSYLCPKTKRWHFSLFSFMFLVSNHSKTSRWEHLVVWEYSGWGGGNRGFFVQVGRPSTLEDTMRAFPHTSNSSHEVEIEPTWPKFMVTYLFQFILFLFVFISYFRQLTT